MALAASLWVTWIVNAIREGGAQYAHRVAFFLQRCVGNLAVTGAALGVASTHTVWPDLAVASIMALLARKSGGLSNSNPAESYRAASCSDAISGHVTLPRFALHRLRSSASAPSMRCKSAIRRRTSASL